MKIVLVERTSDNAVNKDQMGGYGINTQVGESFFARWIMRQKKMLRNIPILSLGYMAGIFSKGGHEVEVMHGDKIPQGDLFILASSIVDYKSELRTALEIKKKYPKATTGFIGPFAGYLANEYLKLGDFVIKGEPEYAAMEISKGLIPRGVIESPSLQELDKLPFPKWDFFKISDYYYFPTIRKKPFLSMQSSRGCAFACNYCPYLTYQKNWRARSPENVIEEMKYLKDRFKIKGLLFRDPLFTLDKERSKQIAEGMIKNRFNIEWACETRTDLLDENLIDRMHKAGLKGVNLGIESARQDLLGKASRKTVDIKRQEKIIRYCEKKGIKIIAFYLLGLPNDTVETIKETVSYAKKLNTFLAQFHILTPFPGTEFYRRIKKFTSESDWEKFNSFTPVIDNKNMSKETLRNLKEEAFVKYYFRFSYIRKQFKHLLRLWRKFIPF